MSPTVPAADTPEESAVALIKAMDAEIERLRALCRRLAVTLCDGRSEEDVACSEPAALRVAWSDRRMFVCAAHLDAARAAAANDGSRDRTDAPEIEAWDQTALLAEIGSRGVPAPPPEPRSLSCITFDAAPRSDLLTLRATIDRALAAPGVVAECRGVFGDAVVRLSTLPPARTLAPADPAPAS